MGQRRGGGAGTWGGGRDEGQHGEVGEMRGSVGRWER